MYCQACTKNVPVLLRTTLHNKACKEHFLPKTRPTQHSCGHSGCVSQRKIPEHHVTAMCRNTQNTSTAVTLRTISRLGQIQPAPAAHTRYLASPAAAIFHGKTHGFAARAPAFSPIQSTCNIHAATKVRFAASHCKPESTYAHGNTK